MTAAKMPTENGEDVFLFYEGMEGEGNRTVSPHVTEKRETSRVGWRGQRVGKGAAIQREPFGWRWIA